MNNFSELKRVAEAESLSENPRRNISKGEYDKAFQDFLEEATPAAVLALFAKNERLSDPSNDKGTITFLREQSKQFMRRLKVAEAEIDEDKLHFQAMGQALEGLVAERNRFKAECEGLRKIISESATACGAAVSVECSMSFMARLPSEIASVIGGLRTDAERYRAVLDCDEIFIRYTDGSDIHLIREPEQLDAVADAAVKEDQ